MSKQAVFEYQPDESEKKPAPAQAAAPALESEILPPDSAQPGTETALTVIEVKKETALTVFTAEKGLDPYLKALERQARAAIAGYNIETIAGQDGIRSVAYTLSKSKKPLEKMAEDLNDEAKAQVKKVNAERDRGIKFIDDLQQELRRPLSEYEAKEKSRIDAHKQRLDQLSSLSSFLDPDNPPTSAAVQARIDRLADFKEVVWEEFTNSATAATEKISKELSDLLIRTKKSEDDAAELARLRAAEDERQRVLDAMYADAHTDNIAFDAAAKAKKNAEELADKQRQEREAEIQREKDAAAEEIRIANEKAEEEKAETARIAKAEQDRIQKEKDESDAKLKKAEEDRIALEKRNEEIRVSGHTAQVDRIRRLSDIASPEMSSLAFKGRIGEINTLLEERDFQEFKEDAEKAATKSIGILDILYQQAIEREAAERARQDEAVAQKERDRIAAEQEAERKATAAREADKAHRAKINGEALAALSKAIYADTAKLSDEYAKAIVTAIAKGEIPHISIKY